MRFREAVAATSGLEEAWRAGLGALRTIDKRRILVEDSRRLRGSVSLDQSLKASYPNDPRLDYAVGHEQSDGKEDVVYFIEVHPATDREIQVVMAKFAWLRGWLAASASPLNSLGAEYVWISSGKTSFTPLSPQRRKIALAGIQHTGRVFRIRGTHSSK